LILRLLLLVLVLVFLLLLLLLLLLVALRMVLLEGHLVAAACSRHIWQHTQGLISHLSAYPGQALACCCQPQRAQAVCPGLLQLVGC
jgi:hypothetical protein